MSTKFELVSYLASLISIMESKEDAGLPRGTTLAWEYNRAYAELRGILDKEKEDEARTKQQRAGGKETGTDRPQSESWRGGTAGGSGGSGTGDRGPISWQGGGGPRAEGTNDPQNR